MTTQRTATRRKSTKFDLEALKNQNPLAIKEASEKFPYLTQPQKDLILHQAPDAYAAIVAMQAQAFARIKEADELASKAHLRSTEEAHATHRSTFTSDKPRDEKRDSYDHVDRRHERETNAQNERHRQTTETVKSLTFAGMGTVLLGGLIAVFTLINKNK